MARRRTHLTIISAVLALTLFSSCGDDSSTSDTASNSSAPPSTKDLSSCPQEVVIQTDWWPQAEHGFVYQLLGPEYTIDTDDMSVTGPLVSDGVATGINVRIRAGGPAIGFDPVISRMYSKPETLLGFMSTDIAISQSQEFPTIGVIAPFNISPQIIMWDPATYPEIRSIDELGAAGIPVLYFRNVAYMRYLTGAGILNEDQVRDTYDGFPEQFVTSNGTVAQQGFGTNEPIFYETKLEQWLKPVRYQYLHELGWNPYAQTLSVTPEKKETYDECLSQLVPLIQEAQRAYITDPARTNEIIVDVAQTLNPTTQYDLDLATASAEKQAVDRLVSNSPDGVLGSFDLTRIGEFIELAVPIYVERGDKVRDNLSATDLVTNEYIDSTVSLPDETAR